MLHRAVQVAREGVLNKQGGEVEGPQHLKLNTIVTQGFIQGERNKGDHQLLEVPGLLPRLVAGKHPGSRRSASRLKKIVQFPIELYLEYLGHLFQDVITQVKDVNPVIELAFSCDYKVTPGNFSVLCFWEKRSGPSFAGE